MHAATLNNLVFLFELPSITNVELQIDISTRLSSRVPEVTGLLNTTSVQDRRQKHDRHDEITYYLDACLHICKATRQVREEIK